MDSLEYLFPEYNEAKERERKTLIGMQNEIRIISRLNSNLNMRESDVPVILKRKVTMKIRTIPLFRYIPSRLIMQRIIMRATLLPDYFTEFEPDY